MSHDMRTPLNAIFGFTSLAKQHIDDTEAVCTCLDKLETAGRQLLDLIDKTLEISWMKRIIFILQKVNVIYVMLCRIYTNHYFHRQQKKI